VSRTWAIEYDKIASRFPKDQLAIFCLPVQSAYMLLSVTERLKWHSSYSDVEPGSQELDAIQEVIELAEKGLMDYKTLDDIFEEIKRVADALEALIEAMAGSDIEAQLEALRFAIGVLEPGALPLLALVELTNQAVGTQHLLESGE
jgi:hypothetical protein